jgi:hypothetical protein
MTTRQIGHLVPKRWRAQQRRQDRVSEVGFTEHAVQIAKVAGERFCTDATHTIRVNPIACLSNRRNGDESHTLELL